MNRFARCLAAAAATWLLAAPAAAEVYKWVDESGVTHYSQQPPPEGERTIIKTQPAPPSAIQQQAADAGTGGDAAEDGGEAQTVEEFCAELRERVEMLASDQPLRMKTGDGKLVPLAGEDRESQLGDARAQVAQHCG